MAKRTSPRRRCPICKERKPIYKFGRDRQSPSGHRKTCLKCEAVKRGKKPKRYDVAPRYGADILSLVEARLYPGRDYSSLTKRERIRAIHLTDRLMAQERARG